MKTRSIIMGLLALGTAISFMPAKAQAYDNEYCREYTRTVYVGNRQEVAYGTACYQPNGDWKIVDEDDRSRIGQRFTNQDVEAPYQPAYQPAYRPVYQPVNRIQHYHTPPQRTRIIFISDNDRRHYGHYKKRDRWDRHARWDRHDNHRDSHRDRGHR